MDFDPKMPKTKTLARSDVFAKPKLLDRPPTMHSGSPKSKADHMSRRKDAGLSHAEVGKEFGVSKSTSHRTISKGMPQGKQGFDTPKANSESIPD